MGSSILSTEVGCKKWSPTFTTPAPTAGKPTITSNLRLPGQYWDEETGLHQNYFKDYDPGVGRYIQSDPIGLEGGVNRYAYVEGNPICKKDPKGLGNAGCDFPLVAPHEVK